jgi:hypothetical protein
MVRRVPLMPDDSRSFWRGVTCNGPAFRPVFVSTMSLVDTPVAVDRIKRLLVLCFSTSVHVFQVVH